MRGLIGSIVAATALLLVTSALQAQTRPLRDRSGLLRPPPGPTLTLTAPCTTGPAPQVQMSIEAVYVRLAWLPVANATSYSIHRVVTTRPENPVSLVPERFFGNEFWDAVPDPRDTYQYTVTATQPNGCMGIAKVVASAPFATPNPSWTSGTRLNSTTAELAWREMPGAIAYRIDGPGLPNTGLPIPGGTFTLGTRPTSVGKPHPKLPAGQGLALTTRVAITEYQTAFSVVALYAGAFADYSQRTAILIPRTTFPVCTGVSPTSGPPGVRVTIAGTNFEFADKLEFGGKPVGFVRSPTTLVATLPDLPAGRSWLKLTTGGTTVCDYRFDVNAGRSQVLVPYVVGLSVQGATQVIQQAGLKPRPLSGPAQGLVNTQSPQAGVRLVQDSEVSFTTVAVAAGISALTLVNNTQDRRSVFIWLYDATTAQWDAQNGGSALDVGDSTKLDLTSAHQYLVFAVDPLKCGGQNDPTNSACERWRVGPFAGDSNGPSQTLGIN